MDNLRKARMERSLASAWINGVGKSQSQIKAISDAQGLSMEMVKWWYGKLYHDQERASHGYR